MLSDKKELFDTLDKINGVPILVIGDIILDRYIWGAVERISPEAPVPVVDVQRVEDRLGGAGNVVRNLCCIGAKVSLCGFIGDDKEGKILLSLLDELGVEKDGVIVDRERTSALKTRVIAHRQQVCRIDRETRQVPSLAMQTGFAAIVDAKLDSVSGIVLSDYGKGSISAPVLNKLSEAKASKKIGIGIKPWFVDPHPTNYSLYNGVSVCKPNRKEAEIASAIKINSKESAMEAAKVLIKRWNADMMVITLGEDGLMILGRNDMNGLFMDTIAQEVYDVSGAGDTVTAVFLAALSVGANAKVAGDLANIAAGIVVSEVGTVAAEASRIRSKIEELIG